ncbi:MAG: hypothetical protein CVU14_10420 [Bacteroidetes bacterium HGW-Bacteroidetes-9]|nr:MAG: hypothetical protein CVU14_10420 [Bacteroidetes bacterium HGW-Bacteroidetes-9]
MFWVQKGKRAKGRKEVRERKGVLGSIAARFKGSMPYGRSEYWVQSSILIMKAGVFPCISAFADPFYPRSNKSLRERRGEKRRWSEKAFPY